ncbi:MAG: hypothetical protein LBK29_01775 [Oscillospiraceae bacterium]|jgi:hypothetical protein|nr:hypothetical protein [Oscillospiraceae bacterium]
MSENFVPFRPEGTFLNNNFKEAVCIDAYRVYDSCADKDCLEDLRCYFNSNDQAVVEEARNVKMKHTRVIYVSLDIEPLPFQKGFYSIDMTFFFAVTLDAYMGLAGSPRTIHGLCIFCKKVILYGSEGSVKVYSSDFALDHPDIQHFPVRNLPRATVQVAEPIGLSAKICEVRDCSIEPARRIPDFIAREFGGEFVCGGAKQILATIGLFTIVQIERNVQILVPSYDFGFPEKECVASTDNPCELFSRIEFPTSEFFPPKNLDSTLPIISTDRGCVDKHEKCIEKCEEKCREKCCSCKGKCNCECKHRDCYNKCGC